MTRKFLTYSGKPPKLVSKKAKQLYETVSKLLVQKTGEKVLIKNIDPKLKKMHSEVCFWRFYVMALDNDLSNGVTLGQDEKVSAAQAFELLRAKDMMRLATLKFWVALKERYGFWCVTDRMSIRKGWKLVSK